MNRTELLDMMNTASRDGLMTISGIGSVTADSIIANRPYTTLPDTYQVTGINASFVERILELDEKILPREINDTANLIVETENKGEEISPSKDDFPSGLIEAPEDPILLGPSPTMSPDKMLEPPAEDLPSSPVVMDTAIKEEPTQSQISAGESQTGEPEGFLEENDSSSEKVEEAAADRQNSVENEPYVQAAAVSPETAAKAKFEAKANLAGNPQKSLRIPFWKFLLSGAVTALITILLTLAIMNAINGSLDYATSSKFGTLQRETAQLNEQVVMLQQDLDTLRSRVDILNGLNDRTVTLEKSQKELSDSLAMVNQELSDLQDHITNLDDQLALQEERTGKFETFLQNLQTLLSDLYAPEGASK